MSFGVWASIASVFARRPWVNGPLLDAWPLDPIWTFPNIIVASNIVGNNSDVEMSMTLRQAAQAQLGIRGVDSGGRCILVGVRYPG